MGFGIKKIDLTKEILSIELLRGIASAMVCFFHLSAGNKHFLPEDNTMRKIGSYGWTGVEVFFVIPYAMFVKNYTPNNLGTFLKKRVIRIEPWAGASLIFVRHAFKMY
ncbi:acyltransferase family protein [Paraflavitalea devenefica]|uniref:acyltransferase family protein n=1 Tax=Paraflavitalea devenefica TaxID=2716334 RepID=UPI003742984A